MCVVYVQYFSGNYVLRQVPTKPTKSPYEESIMQVGGAYNLHAERTVFYVIFCNVLHSVDA